MVVSFQYSISRSRSLISIDVIGYILLHRKSDKRHN